MDVASSADRSTSRLEPEDEPIPANERPKAALVSAITHQGLDGNTERQIVDDSDRNKDKLSSEESFRTSASVACDVQSPDESVSVNLPEIGQLSSFTASRMTESPSLGFEPNEDRQTSAHCKDAELDVDTQRHGAQVNVLIVDDNLDSEKGISAIRTESQMNSHDSNHNNSIALEKLDRNGSSGERVCRVCYMGFAAQPENGPAIELGCQCKQDLAFAHRQCAEAWFKIKGNRTCEICGSTVENVSGINESTFMENLNDADARVAATSEGERCWQNHRIFNVLLACMVFAFVLPWLIHVSALFG